MRHGRIIDFASGDNGETRQVFVFDDELDRYVMKFDVDTNAIVMSYYDPSKPPKDERPIRKIVQRTYAGSAANRAFTEVLDNYHLKALEDTVEYKPKRHYVITDPKVCKDLTDVANNIKMPKDFRDFFFEVSGGGKILEINTVVTQADIDRLGLDTDAMNTYLASLEDFKVIDEAAGWR
jgi:hypothetical protein